MWFFKRNTELKPIAAEGKWMVKLKDKMRQGAQWLNEQTASYSKRKWLVVLGFFCLTFGLWSLAIIYSSLKPSSLKKGLLSKPGAIKSVPVQKLKSAPLIPKSDMNKVARFEAYFNSLSQSEKDSLLRYRPGLFDTVAQLKKLYAEQEGKDSTSAFNNPK